MLHKIKTFIKEKVYKIKPYIIEFIRKRDLKTRTGKLLWLCVDIIGTGLIIWYCMKFRNFVSYGLTVAVGLYLLREVVSIFKTPYKELRQKW